MLLQAGMTIVKVGLCNSVPSLGEDAHSAPQLNDYFALCIAFAASSLTVAPNVGLWFRNHDMAEYFAALAALAVFAAVQGLFLWNAAARQREAARRQWQHELRTRGA